MAWAMKRQSCLPRSLADAASASAGQTIPVVIKMFTALTTNDNGGDLAS